MDSFEYQKSENGKWPVEAILNGVRFVFTGSPDPVRVARERTAQKMSKVWDVVGWALAIMGVVGFLYSAYEFLYFDYDILFLFRRHPANFFGWVGSLGMLYVWAKKLHEESQTLANNSISIAKLNEWSVAKKTIDLFDLFNDRGREVWDSALSSGMDKTNSATFLQSLISDKSVQMAFFRFGVDPELVAKTTQDINSQVKLQDAETIAKLPFIAFEEALRLKNRAIDPLMIFSALVKTLPDAHPIAKIFFTLDFTDEKLDAISAWIFNLEMLIEDDKLVSRIARHRSDKGINRGLTAVPTPYLNQFSQDLTLSAKYHRLPLTRGREKDTEEVIKFLGQGRSVLVLGGKGTGRRTVLYDLAYRMAGEQVPSRIQDKRLIELELAGILGSSTPPEQVIVNVFSEAEKSGNIIFALPDAHELAKAVGNEGLPVLEIFLSHLANSSVPVVATATPESLQTSLKAIPRLQELLAIHELSGLDHFGVVVASAIRASALEAKHGVFFQYQAIEEAVNLTNTISTGDAGQPEKAIEVLQGAAEAVKGLPKEQRIIRPANIQKVVADLTHVPVEALSDNESEKLLHIEDELAKSIIGQKEAVTAVSEALRRARSGLNSGSRPLASFLFVGPTGVGKTELARTLAKVYFGKPEFMLRLDMSEYQSGDGMRKLLGSGPESSDTPFVVHLKTYPFCLFLLDELEKASDEVLNLFLQVLEDGRITTSSGQTLDLTHTIVIATSNAGTREIQEGLVSGRKLSDIRSELVDKILIQHYRPEFLNRFDGIILFSALQPAEVEAITRLQLKLVVDKLLEQKVRLAFDDSVIEKVAKEAFDPLLGARPVRRYIQDHVESVIAKMLLSKALTRGSEAAMSVSDTGEFVVK